MPIFPQPTPQYEFRPNFNARKDANRQRNLQDGDARLFVASSLDVQHGNYDTHLPNTERSFHVPKRQRSGSDYEKYNTRIKMHSQKQNALSSSD